MLVHLFNVVLKARNGSAIVALRWTPLFELPLSDGTMTYCIVDGPSTLQQGGKPSFDELCRDDRVAG
jgi:hypothetical protein